MNIVTKNETIHKAITNLAEKFDILVDLFQPGWCEDTGKELPDEVWLYDAECCCEPFAMYLVAEDGLHFKSNVYMPQQVSEELPAWIPSVAKFKEVLEFLYSEDPSSWG